jgi:4'-phosphopantetheinyl transferase
MTEAAATERGDFEVRVWRSRIGNACVGGEIECLSGEERGRAAQLRRRADRDAWVAAHVFLRRVLARELGVPPGEIHLVPGPNGKPGLDRARGPADLYFNLSHSADIALVAVSREGEVGVDVERRHDGIDAIALARTGIGRAAVAHLSELPPPARVHAFFRLWVRHEAALKCLGAGLGTPQDVPAAEPSVADVGIAPGYVAAVAGLRAPARSYDRLRVTIVDEVEGGAIVTTEDVP